MIVALSPAKKQKSRGSIVRLLAILALTAGLAVSAIIAYASHTRKLSVPAVTMLVPNIGNPGDIIRIEGRNFGRERGLGRVEFDGIAVTASAYLSWTDNNIEVRIPLHAGSGLVRVINDHGRSNSRVFVSQSQLPTTPESLAGQGIGPQITGLSTDRGAIGSLVTIRGLNFGVNRDTSAVLFTWTGGSSLLSAAEASTTDFISPSDRDGEYVLWSDKEIRVRVPDGASSGGIAIRTPRGISSIANFEITGVPGARQYGNRRTYTLNHFVSISNVVGSAPNSLHLWMPNPLESATQRLVQILDRSHQPLVQNYHGMSIYRLNDLGSANSVTLSQSHVVQVYSLDTEISPDAIRTAPSPLPFIYELYTRAEPNIPASDAQITQLARRVVARERNPYRIARLLFDAVLAQFSFDYNKPSAELSQAFETGTANAWDMVRLYVALLRAEAVPARPVAGVVLDEVRRAWPHQWLEFYIYGFGWIPVDIVMASGARSAPFEPILADFGRYFGSIDDRHIVYSRGIVPIVPMTPDGRLSAGTLRYSLQSVKEEVSGDISSYNALWSDVELTGFY